MRRTLTLLVLLSMPSLMGCNTVGPRTIRGARLNYNEAIARSWDQQLLLNLVRLKYRDTPFFLEVSSVSTQYNMNYSVSASPGISTSESLSRSAGAGTSRAAGAAVDFAAGAVTGDASGGANGSLSRGRTRGHGRSLDFDTGVSYDETPTVLYQPLQGQEFVRQMVSPIAVEAIMLLSESGWSVERVMRMCLEEMNGLDNASAASGPTPDWVPPYEEFARAAELLRELQLARVVELAIEESESGPTVILAISPEAQDSPEVEEFRTLLNLDSAVSDYPVVRSRLRDNPRELSVRSRSLLGVMYFLSEGVEPPQQHQDKGHVTVTKEDDDTEFEWSDVVGDLLQVHSQDNCPEDAFVRVRYRGTWFYIDDADLNSKSTFGLLSYLFYLQAGDIKTITPALTLPLGR